MLDEQANKMAICNIYPRNIYLTLHQMDQINCLQAAHLKWQSHMVTLSFHKTAEPLELNA